MNIEIKLQIPAKRFASLLTCALEGGSGYWANIEEKIRPDDPKPVLDAGWENARVWLADYPLQPGGAILISDRTASPNDVRTERLDYSAVIRGAYVMAERYPRQWADFLSENEDAETGDVFLQCCLFGDAIYG